MHKQYGHFVLDNVRVNAMGVSCTIKRVRFMYKGDGIDNEVAKCALTGGESEKKADVPKVLTDLLEKISSGGKSDEAREITPPKAGACYAVPCPAPHSGTGSMSSGLLPPTTCGPAGGAAPCAPAAPKPMPTIPGPSSAKEKKTAKDKPKCGKTEKKENTDEKDQEEHAW
jgi:hypothetical protein